jgi:hypothetical protein
MSLPVSLVSLSELKYGDRDGSGMYQHTNGQLLLSRWRQNEPVGQGVQWSADRKHAFRVVDGRPNAPISHEQAAAIANELGAPRAAKFEARKPITWCMATAASMAKATQGDHLMATKARRQRSADGKNSVVRI